MLNHIKRIIIAVVGATVIAIGLALLVLPGPAVLVLAAGLAILATEFVWARRLLRSVKDRMDAALKRRERRDDDPGVSGPR